VEDGGKRGAVFEKGLSLDTDFIAGRPFLLGGMGGTLVGNGPKIAIAADAEDLAGGTEDAIGRVVEGVLLEGAGRVELKTEAGKTRLQANGIVDRELEFDLGALH
jgi:hypothetical protein